MSKSFRRITIVSAMFVLTACSGGQSATTTATVQPPQLSASGGQLEVTLTAAEGQVPYDGSQRWAMTYNGSVNGPTLRVHPGDRLTIHLVNDLNQPTSLHTHGLHLSPAQDDPFVMVEPGTTRTFTYDIPADQQAGTFWYHPHVHQFTAEQVAAGLSGAIIVEDGTDAQLSEVSTDRVLVVNDPPLGPANPGSGGMHSGGMDMMTSMMGRTGPRLLTDGADGVELVGSGGKLERAHIINATASSSLRLSYAGARMLVLASEGARLGAAQEARTVDLAPGERTEVVLIPGPDGGRLMGQRLSVEGGGAAVGAPEQIASVAPDAGTDTAALPAHLQTDARDLFAPDVRIAQRRVISLDGHMRPTIDGRPFDPNVVNFTAKKGTVEEWVIQSNSPMAHPMHLHSWPFQVQGEEGWQDVVTVPPGGRRVIRVAYSDFGGRTVIHCHILDHEDLGMMAVIEVR